WCKILDSLLEPFLDYTSRTMGQDLQSPGPLRPRCRQPAGQCMVKTHSILCLLQGKFEERLMEYCSCEHLCSVLVRHGLFPTSLLAPRLAISVHLLDFYQASFERSCDAINAFAATCKTRSITPAVQWYDNLLVLVDKTMDAALKMADNKVQRAKVRENAPTNDNSGAIDPDSNQTVKPEEECDWVLQHRCPACFSGNIFGLSLDDRGGDIHVSIDGNFNHRHIRREGNTQQYFQPEYYLPKDYVDEVGDHLDLLRKKTPKSVKPKVPDAAVDECEDGHIAASGKKVKTSTKIYDDTGTMALVCRHDIPIFLANIDTPGEQQKYAVALIKKLYSMAPKTATVLVFYDIGCVLDRTFARVSIAYPSDITSRLAFVTSAMHAYAHQWACQLYYNPRLRNSTGLSDGEGTD
ncbi:hypothetical protein FA15DRAFT_557774, partial [Coprinopsis marcescibilis]